MQTDQDLWMDMHGIEYDKYNIHEIKQGARQWICPKCSADRKTADHRRQKCMTVNWNAGIGHCNHCGEKVQLHSYRKKQEIKSYLRPVARPQVLEVSDDLFKYSTTVRKVSRETLDLLKVASSRRWMPKAQKEIPVMEFPYYVRGELVNIKYRGKNKDFSFEKDCETVMFNLDNVMFEAECVIVEGEWDALSYVESGVLNVTSVPNGFTLPRKDGSSTINLSYLDDYWQYFENKEKIYLAVDNDEAGNHGRQELIRRLGAEKCWSVDLKDCKDANEYLIKYGKEALAKTIESATPLPMENVSTLADFRQDLLTFYLQGSPKGLITGMDNLDGIYSIDFGQYTIVTGPPQSGKSEMVDSICLGYAMKYDYRIGFASPENKPNHLHADKIIRKLSGFRPSGDISKNKIVQSSLDFYLEHFYHVEFNDGYDLSRLLRKFREMVKRKGVRVFVIDPFNKIRLKESFSKHINEYSSDYLQEIDVFCRETKSIIYLVAHPTKLKKAEGTNSYVMPSAYDIKGGGEMFDMAYHILGVRRNMEYNYVEVKTLKIKFQHLGKFEEQAYFKWNVNNGRYVSMKDPSEPGSTLSVEWDNHPWVNQDSESRIPEISFEPNILEPTGDAPF